MKQRGRKPSSTLAVVPDGVVEAVPRPKAPRELSEEQAGVWKETVESLAADWFPPETFELLAIYCRHVVAARRVAALIAQMESIASEPSEDDEDEVFDLDAYDKLLKMQEREGRAVSSLATRMRLTQQATYDKEKSKGKGRGVKKPWDK